MDACVAVEKEVDKVYTKFSTINDHSDRVLVDLISYIEKLKNELESGKILLSIITKEL